VKKAFIANLVVYWFYRITQEAITATIALAACLACMLTLIPATEHHYVRERWNLLEYGYEETANGQSSIVAAYAESLAQTA